MILGRFRKEGAAGARRRRKKPAAQKHQTFHEKCGSDHHIYIFWKFWKFCVLNHHICELSSEVRGEFPKGHPDDLWGPPLRVIAFGTTVLRAPWTDFNNFWFLESSEAVLNVLIVFWSFWTKHVYFRTRFPKSHAFFSYVQATGWGLYRRLRSVLSGGNGRKAQALSFPLLRIGGRCIYGWKYNSSQCNWVDQLG